MKPRSARFYLAASPFLLLAMVAAFTVSVSVSGELLSLVGARPMVTRTWDGGGATNNWSDGANWSGDVAPGSGDDVVFDASSTKNAVIDIDFSISSLQINAGYTGTISQGGSSLSINGAYTQAAGNFNGGSGVLNLSSNFSLSGGTFNAGSGTVAFVGSGGQNVAIPEGFALNNLILNKPDNIAVFLVNPFTVTVNGTLSLTNGSVDRNSFGTLDAKGDVLIASTFDGGSPINPPAFLNITGAAVRTVTFPVGAKMLPLTVNAPNVTLNFSGAGTFTFTQAVDVQNAASFGNGPVNLVCNSSFSTNGFNQGSGNLTFNSAFTQTAGTFTLGSGSLTFNSTFTLNGGTFNAPSGTLNFPATVTIAAGATFNHNGGTIVFNGTAHQTLFVPSNAVFLLNNVVLSKADNTSLFFSSNGTVTVTGTLTLTEGGMDLNSGGTKIDAQGGVIMASTFDGGPLFSPITLQISGPATRTVTFPVGAKMLPLIVNAPNVTVNTSGGAGTFTFSSIDLQSAASFTNGSVNTVVNGPVNLGSAAFTQGSGDLTFQSNYAQTGGTFTASSGALDFNAPFALNGGTFTAPAGVVSFAGELRFPATGTFVPNGGTVIFDGAGSQFFFIPTTFTLNNVVISKGNNTSLFFNNSPSTLVAAGSLTLNDGKVELNSVANIDAQGSVTVGSAFDGGALSNFRFTGSANQTFTNNGGVNPVATLWQINKPSGVVTAASDLNLGGNHLGITSGTLYLNQNSDLTTGPLSLQTNGRLVNDSATTITLGGNVTNGGTIDLNGGGASCPGTDTILIRSSSAAQRTWEGPVNRLIDVDVQNMGGTTVKTVYSGTNSGGNSATWVFDNGCPPELSITPSVAGVPAGEGQNFTAAGGFPPYTFSLAVNNSGGTIEAATGIYRAGTTMGVSDTVRVTDAFGSTADATVNVVGIPTRLVFTVQPSNTAPFELITPAVQVATQDANGNLVTTIRPHVTLSIGTNPSGGILVGTLTRQVTNGIAVFDDLRIGLSGIGYTLQASNIGLATATSNPFNITAAPGVPTRLAFKVQPSDVNAGFFYQMRPNVEVAIVDDFGTVVPTASAVITLGPPPGNPTGLQIVTGETKQTLKGVAEFTSLVVDGIAPGHTVVATGGPFLPATSTPFTIHPENTVFSINDFGPGSLREAIASANVDLPGLSNNVTFNIPGPPPHVISVSHPFGLGNPFTLAPSVVIDATTQPGYAGVPLIELRNADLGLADDGLNLSDQNTVKGLGFTGFRHALVLNGNGNTVQANFIGTNLSGTLPSPNMTGIQVRGSTSMIGGAGTAERNLISGNLQNGIIGVSASPDSGNVIVGNLIGTDVSGTAALPNDENGIMLLAGRGFSITDNVISGNLQAGIAVFGSDDFSAGAPVNLIQNNIVGMDRNAASSLANGRQGIVIDGAQKTQVSANRIFGNGLLGLQLGYNFNTHQNPPLPNDPGDLVGGGLGNSGQNYPVLNTAISENGTTTITGSLNSRPHETYRLEFFSSPSCDASGHGEGETFVGFADVQIGPDGIVALSPVLPVGVTDQRFITATATDMRGNTSEFSNCVIVAARFSISGRVLSFTQNVANAVVTITGVNGTSMQTLTDTIGRYSFSGLPPSDYTIVTTVVNSTVLPASLSFPNLGQNHIEQNFGVVQNSATLQGQVRTSSNGSTVRVQNTTGNKAAMPPVPAGGFPLFGVTFNLTGPVNRTITNDSFGNYNFDELPAGTYTLTPSKPNYLFTPVTATVNIEGADQTANFSAESLGLSTLAGRIVYDSLGQIKAMNADGSGMVSIARVSRILTHSSPRLSANGARAVHISRSTTNTGSRVIGINADGTGANVLSTSNNNQSSPAFSRDGSRIAFNDSDGALVTMNVDGSNVTRVISRCAEPDWSPDGTKIVCLETDSGTTRVKVVELNSTAQTTIDGTSGLKFSPRWSPDGMKIAFIRRQSGSPAVHSIVVRNLLAGTDTFMVGTNNLFESLSWSPDGARLLFTRDTAAAVSSIRPPAVNKQLVTIQASDGQNMLVIVDGFIGNRIDWGNSNTIPTPASIGGATTIQLGAVTITLPGATGPDAVTTITLIEANSAGSAPDGFVIGNFAFEINTTAGYTPPVTICVDLDQFSVHSRLMHNENGVLVNITTSFDETTGVLCGQANSFSPFVVAEQIDPALPSITGLVIDSNGDPINGVSLNLTGAETSQTQTDSNGLFHFVNLTNGANYNVQPQSVGYMFDNYSQDFLGVTGESTVVFTGALSNFQISGRIANPLDAGVAGVTVQLDGAASDEVVTDAGGNYVFTGLPSDGSYFVTPSDIGLSFTPGQLSVSALTGDITGMNFTAFAPTAASVSVGGRVMTADARGIDKAVVTIADASGNVRRALTNPFGYYRFDGVEVGATYILTVEAKQHQFENPARTVSVTDELIDVNFIALPNSFSERE